MVGKILDILDKVLTFFEEWTLFVAVIVAMISLFANVILRYGFNYTLAWSDELIREVIIYTTLIGCSAGVKHDLMLRIDASVQLVPKLKIPLTFFSNLMMLIFAVMMMYFGWILAAMQLQTEQKTIILEIPLYLLYGFIPLMGFLMTIRLIQVFYKDIMDLVDQKTSKLSTSA
ncbi:MAG: TRAP transporter small permease [Deltaproteobacteria bacterium]|jgi:TRAP-type C4-dicarboxylate transport system permease small subunit|nr:TRAP transporter small permease [Deltaproteobacteria bacterium]MBT4644214.1 TRAP transporter small permease [Deltaproteobacteria bacterium]MBT6500478.1 TRAP transporter small permease [Deltaproteobacteria bacterium]MBT6614546.1 TRAP transporter small permease [Deltaproteobacteria bacterium]MBT7154715.1 TRAP transporter small permease [Deltaproteobacteria bacterium]